ncbi:MAG: site-specific integrase [Terracidiphilus sp.]|jgi:integrase
MTTPDQPATLTISVFTRHSADCPKKADRFWRRCSCRKSLYIYEAGKASFMSARTRSWEKAQKLADAELDKRDPVKIRLREIEAQEAAKRAAEAAAEAAKATERLTIQAALREWDLETHKKHVLGSALTIRTFMRKVEAWAKEKGLVYLDEVTRESLRQWKVRWSPNADRLDDRMGDRTQSQFQGRLQEFFGWAYNNEKIDRDPSAALLRVSVKVEPTQPTTPEQFEELLATLPKYDAGELLERSLFGKRLRSIFTVMRWTGLRISDVLCMARSSLKGNRLTLVTKKTHQIFDEIVNDEVIAALADVEPRDDVHPDFYFWSRACDYRSLVARWCAVISDLNDRYLSFHDEYGRPMRFRSHMLRNCFAVEMLLAGKHLEEVARWLGHTSPETTRKYYNAFVVRRQKQSDASRMEALKRQGATFTA